ncbi:unnamed protein product [Microthlaspi erraticum]|uniref:TIR domain-containing protein n=1 Tax=Microthlaspi erraticum TaxID=1685480 RepID=A0A6D2IZP4_9BRAS|nr:unnamed protein product [Microthlaspi erraticum]
MAASSSRNWLYDVFPSFRGEDVRVTFLSHFLKELDPKLISAFKDSEIERSRSLDREKPSSRMQLGIRESLWSYPPETTPLRAGALTNYWRSPIARKSLVKW